MKIDSNPDFFECDKCGEDCYDVVRLDGQDLCPDCADIPLVDRIVPQQL